MPLAPRAAGHQQPRLPAGDMAAAETGGFSGGERTPMAAVRRAEAARTLVDPGADVETEKGIAGRLLHRAAERGRVVGETLRAGASATATQGGIVLTNDGNAILREIDVTHPAAKAMIDLSRTQDEEVGDGTTSVIILAGEMMHLATPFLEKSIHPTVVVRGYARALQVGWPTRQRGRATVELAPRERKRAGPAPLCVCEGEREEPLQRCVPHYTERVQRYRHCHAPLTNRLAAALCGTHRGESCQIGAPQLLSGSAHGQLASVARATRRVRPSRCLRRVAPRTRAFSGAPGAASPLTFAPSNTSQQLSFALSRGPGRRRLRASLRDALRVRWVTLRATAPRSERTAQRSHAVRVAARCERDR